MRNLIFGLVLFLVPQSVFAGTQCENAYQAINRTLLNGVALNAAAASRTFTLTRQETEGYGVVAIYLKLVRVAATAVTMACTVSNDNGTTSFTLQSCDIAAGVCTSSDASWSKTVAGNKNWVWRIDTLGLLGRISCLIDSTAGGANDLITATAAAAAQ